MRECRRSLALADALGDREGRASALAKLGEIQCWAGDPVNGAETLREAVAASQAAGARRVEAGAQQSLGAAFTELSQHQAAQATLHAAMEIYRELGDAIGEGDVLSSLGAIHVERGELDEAEQCYARALTIQNKAGFRYGAARTTLNWGNIFYLRGEIGQALARFADTSAIAHEIDSARLVRAADMNIAATVSTFIGDTTQGRQAIGAVMATLDEDDNRIIEAQAEGIHAQFDMLAGDFDAAERRLARCVELQHEGITAPWILVQGYQQQAYLALYRQRYDGRVGEGATRRGIQP